MTQQFEPLDKNLHKELKIDNRLSFKHLIDQNIIPLVAQEYGFASGNFPILFVKDPDGNFRSVGVTGIEPNKSLIFTDNEAKTEYFPLDIQRYPFAVMRDQSNERMIVCVDVNSELVGKEVGEDLFDGEEELGQRAKQSQEMLRAYVEQEAVTNEMLRFLDELDLIQPAQIQVTVGEEQRALNGLFRVDDKKLAELEDEQVLTLHKRNYFAAIYSHLNSLVQMQKLVKLQAEKA